MRILVVEDNRKMAALLQRGLKRGGHVVSIAYDAQRAMEFMASEEFDVAVVDWMLPGMQGIELIRTWRAEGREMPALLLTARDAVQDRVEGLDAGADDYLVKPFAFEELDARLRVLHRRGFGIAAEIVDVGELRVDIRAQRATCAGQALALTAREYQLLELLARHRGRVLSRQQILVELDEESLGASNVVDVHVAHLRKKIEQTGVGRLIHTRRGLGYVLEVAT